jgi:hypothetical protein
VTAELVLATLLETARLGDSGPETVAANARRRVDTSGAGGQIPGDTPWQPGLRGFGRTTPATVNGHPPQQARATTGARPSRFQQGAETPRSAAHPSAKTAPNIIIVNAFCRCLGRCLVFLLRPLLLGSLASYRTCKIQARIKSDVQQHRLAEATPAQYLHDAVRQSAATDPRLQSTAGACKIPMTGSEWDSPVAP